MMRINIKKVVASVCCLAMMLSVSAIPVSSADNADTAAADDADEEEAEEEPDKDVVIRTDEEAMADMSLVTENAKLALYRSTKRNDTTLALVDKNTGKIWWSNPINADASSGKKTQIQELKAGMSLIYGEPSKRRTTVQNSKVKGKVKIKEISNGVEINYTFNDAKITIPVTYTLEEDHLKMYLNTSEMTEEDGDKIAVNLSFMTTFGAAEKTEEGYFVIPDGSGAVINFNNGKTGFKTYTGKVYGADITAVSQTAAAVTQQVYLPMYGIVKGNSGMMVVADKGDTCASINSYVADQNKTSYNACYFDFEIRTDDEYLMGGEANPLKVFEKRGILIPEIEIRYYPVSNSDQSEVDYVDIADKYRDYIMSDEYGVKKSDTVSETPLYIDFMGGTMKTESILGIPVNMQHKVTAFADAQDILSQLSEGGADNMVVNYNQWTAADIKEKVSDSASPAPKLGGKKDFNKLLSFAESNNIDIYPAVDNLTFRSGNGYLTMTNTAVRVSNAYSRQFTYDLAYGIQNKFYDAMALLAPNAYEKMFNNLAKSYSKYGLTNISVGSASTVIYGDYGKKAVSREMFKYDLQKYYQLLDEQVGSVLADGANAYVLPYVDHITNVPLSSSKFDIFDYDIPLYQMVMHGVKSYSTTPVNGDAEIAELVLKAMASGSNLHFDLIAEEANELKDTRYDVYFYADAQYWTEDAASCYNFAKQILSDVSDKRIEEYNIISDDVIETVYEGGTKITVNIPERTVDKNGTVYSLYDYIGKEVIG